MRDVWESTDIESVRALVNDADSNPSKVVEQTAEMLGDIPDGQPLTEKQAICAWAHGLAARHLRQLDRAYEWLHRASEAFAVGSADHTGVELSRSSTLLYQGEIDLAVEVLRATQPDETLAPRVICQLATANEIRGDLVHAHAGYEQAIAGFRRNGDAKGEAHALSGLGLVNVERGEIRDAVQQLALARSIYVDLGDDLLAAVLQSNIGWAAAKTGDFVTSLEHLTIAGQKLRELGEPFSETALEHALVLLKAGLPGEAVGILADVLPQLEAAGSNTDRAEMLVTFGQALVGYGYPTDARQCFITAKSLFAHQGRTQWIDMADLRLLELELTMKATSPGADFGDVAARALAIGEALNVHMPMAASDALVVAARAAHRAKDLETLRQVRQAMMADIDQDNRLSLVDCFLLDLEGRKEELLEIALEQSTTASSESALPLDIVAALALQTDELIGLGMGAALDLDDHAALASLIERARNPLLTSPSVLPDDDELGDDLRDALRGELNADSWRAISEQVRVRERKPAVAPAPAQAPPIPTEATMIAAIDDKIVVVKVAEGETSLIATHDRRSIEDACRRHQLLLESAVLDQGNQLATALHSSADALQAQLPWLTEDRFDLVAVGPLAELPWTSIAPGPLRLVIGSTTAPAARERSRHLVAIGPRTESASDEAALVRSRLGDVSNVEVSNASPESLIESASLFDVVHLACHADHNRENPLLSSYQLHGGRLRGYEIERLGDAPRVVISSACTAGRQELRGKLQMLGLPATWLAAGAESVIAPSCPIPDDERTTETMAEIHRIIATGVPPEQAVFLARTSGDELVAHTLVTFGGSSARTVINS